MTPDVSRYTHTHIFMVLRVHCMLMVIKQLELFVCQNLHNERREAKKKCRLSFTCVFVWVCGVEKWNKRFFMARPEKKKNTKELFSYLNHFSYCISICNGGAHIFFSFCFDHTMRICFFFWQSSSQEYILKSYVRHVCVFSFLFVVKMSKPWPKKMHSAIFRWTNRKLFFVNFEDFLLFFSKKKNAFWIFWHSLFFLLDWGWQMVAWFQPNTSANSWMNGLPILFRIKTASENAFPSIFSETRARKSHSNARW